jgi:hypothetical protein
MDSCEYGRPILCMGTTRVKRASGFPKTRFSQNLNSKLLHHAFACTVAELV